MSSSLDYDTLFALVRALPSDPDNFTVRLVINDYAPPQQIFVVAEQPDALWRWLWLNGPTSLRDAPEQRPAYMVLATRETWASFVAQMQVLAADTPDAPCILEHDLLRACVRQSRILARREVS